MINRKLFFVFNRSCFQLGLGKRHKVLSSQEVAVVLEEFIFWRMNVQSRFQGTVMLKISYLPLEMLMLE